MILITHICEYRCHVTESVTHLQIICLNLLTISPEANTPYLIFLSFQTMATPQPSAARQMVDGVMVSCGYAQLRVGMLEPRAMAHADDADLNLAALSD